jgi:hypothetical protein
MVFETEELIEDPCAKCGWHARACVDHVNRHAIGVGVGGEVRRAVGDQAIRW